MKPSFRALVTLGLALAGLLAAPVALAQSPADAKRTLKAWELFYGEPGYIEVDVRYMRGTLLMTGYVPTQEGVTKADELAQKLKGVKEVRNRIRTREPDVAGAKATCDEIMAKLIKYVDEDEDLSRTKAKGNLELSCADRNITVKGKLGDYSEASQIINEVRKTIGVNTILFADLAY